MTVLRLDYETFSEAPLSGPSSVGLWNYTRDMSTEVLMVAYQIDDGPVEHVDLTQEDFPAELREALLDPHVIKWAFNAAFERVVTRNTLGIDTPYEGWRCAMALANLQSFSGDLLQVGTAMGIRGERLKDSEGSRLIQLFSMPQKLTRKNSLYRRTRKTDPEDWIKFCDYNVRDVIAEREITDKLLQFPIPDEEWLMYEEDQRINDRGLPVNPRFVVNADRMANQRKAELKEEMRDLTGLRNPNSSAQVLPWLLARGYPFGDLQKNTVRKVLTENREAETPFLAPEADKALRLRQQASRTSVRKYPAIMQRLGADDRLRHCFQFAGAARTARWSGRGPQPQNLTRTPPQLESEDGEASRLEATADAIAAGEYDTLGLLFAEPMVALAGSVRSSFQAPRGWEFVVCDLSAIESAVIAWITGCKRLLHVFRSGLDPYKDFGTELYRKPYGEISKPERTICKPAVLGCGYQLGGGELHEGKRTGLWGYAENMGVNVTREEAHRQVTLFRDTYHEIPAMWRSLQVAAERALTGAPVSVGLLLFAMRGPYLTIRLPSGRLLFYYRPRMVDREFTGRDGEKYVRRVFSYMGMNQLTRTWGRTFSSGGKLIENVTQAVARDILRDGMLRAAAQGFPIVGSVHDEIISLVRRGDNRLTLGLLRECMAAPIPWAKGLPLGAAGYTSRIYRKD